MTSKVKRASTHRTSATNITGQALTDFAVSTISERVDEILARHNMIMLNKQEYNFFLQTLSTARKPSEKSKAAAARYRQGQRKGVKYQF